MKSKAGEKLHVSKNLFGGRNMTKQQRASWWAVVWHILQGYKSINQASKETGIKWHYLKRAKECCEKGSFFEEKKKGTSIQESLIEDIRSFYKGDDISLLVGGIRGVNKKGEQIRYMKISTQTACRKFRKKNDAVISISTFRKYRPRCVKLCSCTPRNECICIYCGKLDLQLNALKPLVSKKWIPAICTSIGGGHSVPRCIGTRKNVMHT